MPRKKQSDGNTSTKRVQTGRVTKNTAKQVRKPENNKLITSSQSTSGKRVQGGPATDQNMETVETKPGNKLEGSIYEDASNKSRRANQNIKNMIFHDEYFRDRMWQIQATYKVRKDHLRNQGYAFRIRLIWDYDRLWGTFELGSFNGVFLVDPGPGQDHFKAEDDYCYEHPYDEDGSESDGDQVEHLRSLSVAREYSLEWRGTSPEMPNTTLNSPLTVGKIRFGSDEIWGYFDAMRGHLQCEFHGKKPPGLCVVSRSIEDVIEEWNSYGVFNDDEVPRLSAPNARGSVEEEDSEPATASSPSASEEWTEEDQKYFLGTVTGIFDITSKAVEEEWPHITGDLTIRFHIDKEEKKIWGQFDVGVMEGYILLDVASDKIAHDTPVKFQWRGRDTGNGKASSGSGQVTISNDQTVKGVLDEMGVEIDFSGRRKTMPGNRSGYEAWHYRLGWEELYRGR